MQAKTSLTTVLAVIALYLVAAPAASALTFTCSTVVQKKVPDPSGEPLRSRFAEPAINRQGDVVFVGKTSQRRLYLYPSTGPASILASESGPAPGGGAFTKFRTPSINDAGDIGFFGDLEAGEGIFVHESGGGLVKAAVSGDAAPPPGGTFDLFPAASPVNAAGDIAFVATVSGGSGGVFLFDRSAATVLAVARAGDPTGDGRRFCDLPADIGLGLSDLGNAVFKATTKVDCADATESETLGLWQRSGVSFTAVAEVGGPAPLAGTTYARFFITPFANGSDVVLLRAQTAGATAATGLFLFDPAGPSTSKVAVHGDAAPGADGELKKIASPGGLTNAGRSLFRSSVKRGTTRDGIFLFDGSPEAVVLGSDPAPADSFGPGSIFRRLQEQTGVDRSGTQVTFSAKVKDTIKPSGKTALFRCTGS